MMDARQLPASDYLAIKAAVRTLIKQCGGTQAASAITRVGQSTLSDYGNANHDAHAAADIIADLEAEIDDPIVTRQLALLSGYTLAALPSAGETIRAEEASEPLPEFTAKVITTLVYALKTDGEISADEIKDLNMIEKAQELQIAIATYVESLKHRLNEGD